MPRKDDIPHPHPRADGFTEVSGIGMEAPAATGTDVSIETLEIFGGRRHAPELQMLGDTATHEVGHIARAIEVENDETHAKWEMSEFDAAKNVVDEAHDRYADQETAYEAPVVDVVVEPVDLGDSGSDDMFGEELFAEPALDVDDLPDFDG